MIKQTSCLVEQAVGLFCYFFVISGEISTKGGEFAMISTVKID